MSIVKKGRRTVTRECLVTCLCLPVDELLEMNRNARFVPFKGFGIYVMDQSVLA